MFAFSNRKSALALILSTGMLMALPLAARADEHTGYVPISGEDSVYLLNTATDTVTKKIRHVGNHPSVVRVLPDHSKIYVDNLGPLTSHITVIDPKTQSIVKKISTRGIPYASMALSGNGRYLFVPTVLSLVQVIDTQTDKVVYTHKVGTLPFGIEASPDGSRFYSYFVDNTVAAYDTRTGRQIGPRLPSGALPLWSALSSDGGTLYVFNVKGNSITVIDTASWQVADTIAMPEDTRGIFSGTLTPDGRTIYVCDARSKTMIVVDTASRTVSQVIATGDAAPAYIGFSPDGKTGYMSDLAAAAKGLPLFFYGPFPPKPGNVVVYDTVSKTLIGKIPVGTAPLAGVYD